MCLQLLSGQGKLKHLQQGIEGLYQCQFPDYDIVLQVCNVIYHWGILGKEYEEEFSVLFLTTACESTIIPRKKEVVLK